MPKRAEANIMISRYDKNSITETLSYMIGIKNANVNNSLKSTPFLAALHFSKPSEK